ncbi:hypothetical protein MSAN_00180800 [Mycena sanguinolenta]|uniref:Ricin B lectin domain-containing protein n=1 Tax=Mycena sanguinolenta TaxID=230812 RepID=A0A8H6ZIL1_9AGAR|nr:hypothetical protein MSAN_00180800 [Mycena sanguinolenta]
MNGAAFVGKALQMQVKAVSLVALALWLARAVDASAFAPRVTPVPDAAIAHVLIKPLLDSTLCLTSDNLGGDSLSSCNGDSSQIWTVNPVNSTIVQFQNVASNLCFAFNGTAIVEATCNNPSNGVPFSGTEWAASQPITQDKLPLAVTGLDNHLGFVDTGLCLDQNGSAPITAPCNGGLSQSWFLFAA